MALHYWRKAAFGRILAEFVIEHVMVGQSDWIRRRDLRLQDSLQKREPEKKSAAGHFAEDLKKSNLVRSFDSRADLAFVAGKFDS